MGQELETRRVSLFRGMPVCSTVQLTIFTLEYERSKPFKSKATASTPIPRATHEVMSQTLTMPSV